MNELINIINDIDTYLSKKNSDNELGKIIFPNFKNEEIDRNLNVLKDNIVFLIKNDVCNSFYGEIMIGAIQCVMRRRLWDYNISPNDLYSFYKNDVENMLDLNQDNYRLRIDMYGENGAIFSEKNRGVDKKWDNRYRRR